MDLFKGRRQMQTFRKLPTTSPRRKKVADQKTSSVVVEEPTVRAKDKLFKFYTLILATPACQNFNKNSLGMQGFLLRNYCVYWRR